MTPEGRPAKVLLAMSGGVDSSVAAALLAQAGHEVVGCFMRLGTVDEPEGMRPAEDATACGTTSPRRRGCCSVGDAEDARLVAARLGIPLYVLNFRRDFDRVIDYFVGEYAAGRTPNPCVRCNDWLKFGRLHDHAESIGASFVASGHYARIERRGDEARLRRGLDEAKDQSYVLFGLPGERLRRTLLPIGGLRKPEVRRLARELELPVFDKPDSQEICFVPDGDYAGLLRRRAPDSVAPGRLVDEEGRTLGEHPGHQHFTIGQRRGLGLATGVPLFVLSKDATRNEVVVGPRERLVCGGAIARGVNWTAGEAPREWRSCAVQWRAHGEVAPARVRVEGEGTEARLEVRFEQASEMLAPGQAIVCYEGDEVLGGGWIGEVLPAVRA